MAKENEFSLGARCPFERACLGRVGCWAVELSDRTKKVLPGVSAEQICPEALNGSYGRQTKTESYQEYKSREDNKAYKAKSSAMRYSLEQGLSHPDDYEAKCFFDDAWRKLVELTEEELPDKVKRVPSYYYEAMIIKAQFNVFKERRHRDGIPLSETVLEAHGHMVNLLSFHRLKKSRSSDRLKAKMHDSLRTEIEMACLLTRLGDPRLFPYWALAREERNHDNPSQNHDWYLFDGSRKSPMVQIKTSHNGAQRQYDPKVLVIAKEELNGVVGSGCSVHNGAISQLLEKEANGSITEEGLRKLGRMSKYLSRRITKHSPTILQ